VLIPKRVELCQLIEATPWLDWLLLTKRPQNIANMVPDAWLKNPLKNVWYGTTCEDQEHAEERVPHLLSVPAAVHFVSYEPALGPVDFTRLRSRGHITSALGPSGGYPAIDWLIVGGESGPKARPFDVRWARWVREQCESTGTAFFMKQLGSKPEDGGTALFTVDKKGGDMLEWPPEIRVREFPRTA
jgi:protein gp37